MRANVAAPPVNDDDSVGASRTGPTNQFVKPDDSSAEGNFDLTSLASQQEYLDAAADAAAFDQPAPNPVALNVETALEDALVSDPVDHTPTPRTKHPATASGTPKPPQLKAPKLGGIYSYFKNDTVQHTMDWSAIAESLIPNSFQRRYDGSAGIKQDNLMRTGLTPKHGRGDYLNYLLLKVKQHLVLFGLDTVAYRTNMTGSLSSVVEHYGSFALDTVKKES